LYRAANLGDPIYVDQIKQARATAYQALVLARSGNLPRAHKALTVERLLVEEVLAVRDLQTEIKDFTEDVLKTLVQIASQIK
jgi:hypothetical protein